jgi:hypothetical protein
MVAAPLPLFAPEPAHWIKFHADDLFQKYLKASAFQLLPHELRRPFLVTTFAGFGRLFLQRDLSMSTSEETITGPEAAPAAAPETAAPEAAAAEAAAAERVIPEMMPKGGTLRRGRSAGGGGS